MLTPYGKMVRKLRIDANMTAREMATEIDVTPSFLSAIETGRKEIPTGFVEKVADALGLSSEERAKLSRAASKSKREFRIAAGTDATDRDRELLEMFARGFEGLSEQRKSAIRKILGDDDQ